MRNSSYYLCLFTVLLLAIPFSHVQAADKSNDKTPLNCKNPPEADNIAKGTHDALACEWVNPKAAEHVLYALQLLTTPTRKKGGDFLGPLEADKLALHELITGDPSHEDLYRAAMGVPDPNGQPTAQGLPDFPNTVAKANTLNKDKNDPTDEHDLFDRSQKVIGEIFKTSTGKQALVVIHDSFSRKDNHVALFQLLVACLGGTLIKTLPM